jgi:predicted transcriptional regulator
MITIKQIRAARAYLGWSQKELADVTNLSVPTIKRLESSKLGKTHFENVQKVVKAFIDNGIIFTKEGGINPSNPEN